MKTNEQKNLDDNLRLLEFIESFEQEYGYQPCLKKMAKHMFFSSTRKPKAMLFELKNAGIISLEKPFRTSKFIVKRIKSQKHG